MSNDRSVARLNARRFTAWLLALLAAGFLPALAALSGGFLPSAVQAAPEDAAAPAGPSPWNPMSLRSRYDDVLVVGASPEGIAAAVSAARSGAETLLVDTAPEPGGLITRGWLTQFDLNRLPDGSLATRGFFSELLARLGGQSFDLNRAREVFRQLLAAEPHLSVLIGVERIAPLVKDRNLGGAYLTIGGQERLVKAERFIDATPDADFAAAAGAGFTVGREALGLGRKTMASTLIFRLAGVDWAAVRRYLAADGNPLSGSTPSAAWGFTEFTRRYRSPDPQIRLRGLNLGRQSDGTVLVNALLLLGVDPLDRVALTEARLRAMRLLPGVVAFLREQVPGFTRARLDGVAPELYVRESRHLKSLYLLTIDDLLEHRDFSDKITLASYPVDLQPYDNNTGQVIGNPMVYSVPFRCLVPLGFDNLLVVGRSAGYDPLAQGSARVLPVGIAEGQAAGTAAVQSLKEGLTFPALAASAQAMARLQAELVRQGAYLPAVGSLLPSAEVQREKALKKDPAYPALRLLLRLGLASGGYTNDYKLDQLLTPAKASALIRSVLARYRVLGGAGLRRAGAPGQSRPWPALPSRPMTRRQVYQVIFSQLTKGA
ncbi:MAG TPA: FAD-dependent oxidoreductase [Firmicutes bacterium]|nr:FAD-dependent oxidoreductase [Bacillota bacterium]